MIPYIIAAFLGLVLCDYEAPPYDPTAKVFLPPDAQRNLLPYTHRDTMPHVKFIPSDFDGDIADLINDKIEYVTWEHMFDEDFNNGLNREMQWIEERYQKDFIDSLIKRNFGTAVPDGQYKDYHRVSKVYWLTFIKKEDYP